MKMKGITSPEAKKRITEYYIKKNKQNNNIVQKLEQNQKSYLAFQKRRQEPGFLYANAYDIGGFEDELKSAIYWRDKFYEEHLEYLL